MTLYEIWESESSTTFIPAESINKNILLEDDSRLIGTIIADTWDEAMTKYHEFMGWSPYKPMN